MASLSDWLKSAAAKDRVWFAKRLSANDTGATGGHQVGLYLSKQATRVLFPGLIEEGEAGSENPKRPCHVVFGSHQSSADTSVTYWNQKTRNEVHMTRWGGRKSPVQNPEQTGALLVLSFLQVEESERCAEAWLSTSTDEDDQLEAICGEVLPGDGRLHFLSGEKVARSQSSCWLTREEIDPSWLSAFPDTQTLVNLALDRQHGSSTLDADRRMIRRRDCEEEIFMSIEEACVLPIVRNGFSTIEQFIATALSVTNRRKSRAGKSLELHLREIFREESVACTPNPVTEENKRPDFIFPSIEAYRDARFPTRSLRMLAVKTTCKDRWRQILNEADRLKAGTKHLLTLQEGVSVSQFEEMKDEGVQLVVPKSNVRKFPEETREQLQTISDFIQEVKKLG